MVTKASAKEKLKTLIEWKEITALWPGQLNGIVSNKYHNKLKINGWSQWKELKKGNDNWLYIF